MSLRALCDTAVTIRSVAWTKAAGGAKVPTYTDTAASASVQPMDAERQVKLGFDLSSQMYEVYFPADPAVKDRDIILYGSLPLAVQGRATDEAGRGVLWVVIAKHVPGDGA